MRKHVNKKDIIKPLRILGLPYWADPISGQQEKDT